MQFILNFVYLTLIYTYMNTECSLDIPTNILFYYYTLKKFTVL